MKYLYTSKGRVYCKPCVLKALIEEDKENILNADEIYRKTQLRDYLGKLEEQISRKRKLKKKIDLNNHCVESEYQCSLSNVNFMFRLLLKEFQNYYGLILDDLNLKKQNVTVLQSEQQSSIEEIDLEVSSTQKDISDNYEKIILQMDLSPFSQIMINY